MTENNLNTQQIYTYEEILRAINKLEPNEKEAVLSLLKINEIAQLFESQQKVDECCRIAKQYVDLYSLLINSIQKLYVKVTAPTDTVEDIVCEYNDLSEDNKKNVALELLNTSTFQKDCCDILVKDFERIVKDNPTLKLLNDTFQITDWYKKNIALGIGCNHEYKEN